MIYKNDHSRKLGLLNKAKHIMQRSSFSPSHFKDLVGFIVDSTNVAFWDLNLWNGDIIYSPLYERMLGYEEGELKGTFTAWRNIVEPDDFEKVQQVLDDCIADKPGPFEVQFRILRKDGSLIWAQSKVAIIERDDKGTPNRLLGIFQDISDIKRKEEEQIETNRQLDLVARLAGLVSWEYNARTGAISYGKGILNILNYNADEIPLTIMALIKSLHPDDRARVNNTIGRLSSGEIDMFTEEVRILTNKDVYLWTAISGQIIEWGIGGKAVRVRGSLLNIDNRKKTEEQLQIALANNESYNERLKAEVQEAVKNLKQTQEFNRIILESNPNIILMFDDTFQLVDCNRTAMQYLGLTSKEDMIEELTSKISQWIPERQPDGRISISLTDRLIDTVYHDSVDFETELIIEGKPIDLHLVFKKIKFKDSWVIVVYGIDLRAIKEAKNELIYQDRILIATNKSALRLQLVDTNDHDQAVWEFLRDIGESVNVGRVGVWQNYESDGKPFSRLIYEWFEETASLSPLERRTLDYTTEVPQWLELAKKNKNLNTLVKDIHNVEADYLKKHGAISVLCIPIYFKGDFWGFIMFEDYKKERIFTHLEENVLHSASIILVSAIQRNEVTINLIKSREEAIAVGKAKSDFLSRMSHEIRTPMNAIIGMATIAQKSSETDRIRYCLDRINSASKQLLGLINDILDISKIEANKLEIINKPFDFEKMVQDTLNVIQVKAEEKKQQVIVDFNKRFDRMVIGDELRFSQVLLNLLSNAVKFTPENGTITVKIHWEERSQDSADAGRVNLHVEVIDTGIGVSMEQQMRLFKSFEQGDGSITRRFGGTGLGLALCKRILNLMGGDIWIKSEIGKGASFIFEVHTAFGNELEQETVEYVGANERILIIDDSRDVLEYFTHILASFSMNCEVVSSGKDGLVLLEGGIKDNNPFNVVLIDWKLPGEDCASIIRRIREIAGDVSVVIMSVADWIDIKPHVKSLDIRQFLPKPVMPSTLYNAVINLGGKRHLKNIVEQKRDEAEGANLVGALEGKRLLVAEDIEINQEILSALLEDTKVDIDFAINGVVVVDMFKKQSERYDLILMDIQMPDLDGFNATRQIRALGTDKAAAIPIIAMTANAFSEDVEACIDAGMNGHLAKPIEVNEMMKALAKYLT
ncbi:MAG: response regulator [Treponema sp.]|jgi:PAS domain S-box-containing protein|nr:response regulator [Treponema sp.]